MTNPSLKEQVEALRRKFPTEPASYKGSDANVYREGCNATIDTILPLIEAHEKKTAEAVSNAVRPYRDGIAKIAQELREHKLTRTADKIEADLKTLEALTTTTH